MCVCVSLTNKANFRVPTKMDHHRVSPSFAALAFSSGQFIQDSLWIDTQGSPQHQEVEKPQPLKKTIPVGLCFFENTEKKTDPLCHFEGFAKDGKTLFFSKRQAKNYLFSEVNHGELKRFNML